MENCHLQFDLFGHNTGTVGKTSHCEFRSRILLLIKNLIWDSCWGDGHVCCENKTTWINGAIPSLQSTRNRQHRQQLPFVNLWTNEPTFFDSTFIFHSAVCANRPRRKLGKKWIFGFAVVSYSNHYAFASDSFSGKHRKKVDDSFKCLFSLIEVIKICVLLPHSESVFARIRYCHVSHLIWFAIVKKKRSCNRTMFCVGSATVRTVTWRLHIECWRRSLFVFRTFWCTIILLTIITFRKKVDKCRLTQSFHNFL